MKKYFFVFLLPLLVAVLSCSNENGECRVHGTAPNPNLEGKCIYLIALDATKRDSIGIDSTFIKDGKFEITTKGKHMMAILRMDYHFRIDTQELLLVEEPGDIYVTVDSISSGHGTKNNDQLQEWKDETEVYASKSRQMSKAMYNARQAGDTVTFNNIENNLKKMFEERKQKTLSRADKLDDGPLKTFFYEMYGIKKEK